MPTGYTQHILDGADFKTYALLCARAFGALITERDEPLTANIPDVIEPMDYHSKKITELKERLSELQNMGIPEQKLAAKAAYDKAIEYYNKRKKEIAEAKRKLEKVLEQARAYTPPTENHVGVKSFMISQIEETLKYDGSDKYLEVPALQPYQTWYHDQINKAVKDISYHTEEDLKEHQRAKERTEWIQQYKKSLS